MMDVIRNPSGEKLDYRFEQGSTLSRKPGWIIVLGHGVTGNLDRPVIADTAGALNRAGFDTLRFSFSGNGDSEGDFRESTISKEVSDLDSVLVSVATKYPKIGYIGHSMGGAVGVMKASEDEQINALVSLAGMVNTKNFAETEFGEEIPDKGLMWEEETCPLSKAFMEDLCETVSTVASQIGNVQIPWLLLHGTEDDVVSIQDSELVKNVKGESVKLIQIEGADHSFNEPEHKRTMTKAVVSWFSQLEGLCPGKAGQ